MAKCLQLLKVRLRPASSINFDLAVFLWKVMHFLVHYLSCLVSWSLLKMSFWVWFIDYLILWVPFGSLGLARCRLFWALPQLTSWWISVNFGHWTKSCWEKKAWKFFMFLGLSPGLMSDCTTSCTNKDNICDKQSENWQSLLMQLLLSDCARYEESSHFVSVWFFTETIWQSMWTLAEVVNCPW